MSDALILAYLAGVIDSDGYITINRSTRKGVVYFGAVIGVSGTRRQPHDLAASIWGGKVSYYQIERVHADVRRFGPVVVKASEVQA